MQGTHGVGNRALRMLAALAYRLDRGSEVAHIVKGIKDAKHVDSVEGGPFHETIHHIIRVVPVAQQILATQQHLLPCFWHSRLEHSNALPGILTEVANTGIEGRSTPGFDCPEPKVIERSRYGKHVINAHARGKQTLMRIAQHHISEREGLGSC